MQTALQRAPPPRAACRQRRRCCAHASAGPPPRVRLVPTPRCRSLGGALELQLPSFLVGTSASAQVRPAGDASIAPEHTRFEWRGGRLFLTDLDSAAGTHFDGVRLRPGVSYLAGDGVVVTFGAAQTEVTLELPQLPAPDGGTEAMLADAFLQRFRAQGSADVRALLQDE